MTEAIRMILRLLEISCRAQMFAQNGNEDTATEVIVHPDNIKRADEILTKTGYFVNITPDRRLIVCK